MVPKTSEDKGDVYANRFVYRIRNVRGRTVYWPVAGERMAEEEHVHRTACEDHP
jgi:hypothetical protein